MLEELKRLARRTSLYGRLQQHRALAALRTWTPLDHARRAFYAQFIGADDIVFDVGANMANRTRVFRELGKHVVAIEPQPLCLRVLRSKFGSDPKVTIVDAAVGAERGKADLNIGDAHTLTTLSSDWIAAVKRSGRFADQRWSRTISVRVTTLDELIAAHGTPTFIKIDVEGHEEHVLRGLSQPVQMISFEFIPEQIDTAVRILQQLEKLGPRECNLVLGENTQFESPSWLPPGDFARDTLGAVPATAFGDIYVRLKA